MRLTICLVSLLIIPSFGSSQQNYLDSLQLLLETESADSNRMRIFTRIGHHFQDNGRHERAVENYQGALAVAEDLENKIYAGNLHYSIGYSHLILGDYDLALENYLNSARYYEEIQDSFRLTNALMSVANVYSENQDFGKVEEYHEKANDLILLVNDTFLLCDLLNSRGVLADQLEDFETAHAYFKEAHTLATQTGNHELALYSLSNSGLAYKRQNKSNLALETFNDVLAIAEERNSSAYVLANVYNNIGSTYAQLNQYSAAESAFENSIEYGLEAGVMYAVMESYRGLSDMYGESGNYRKEAENLKQYYTMKDSIFADESKNQLVRLEADYQLEQKDNELLKRQAEIEQQKNQRNILMLIVIAAILLLSTLGIFYTRIRNKNRLLAQKNTQISNQKDEITDTLEDLKRTQAQLVQSAKLASLGELTAGIAHEIQNPLNFVNNFSELNEELINDLRVELNEGNIQEVDLILKNLSANEKKINHHGRRAEGIVRNMLQHSNLTSGDKILTDINQLVEEYTNLAYHSYLSNLSTDKNGVQFEITQELHSDLPKIKVVPQELGRVLINLLNNAFYAVQERNKVDNLTTFRPQVSLKTSTNLTSDKEVIKIEVKDNGPGIPKENMEKVFQPFFTTKPTGNGTGLGLSLAYDIINSHGGKLDFVSTKHDGTAFTITLPT